MAKGIAVTQQGVDMKNALDAQKVLDTRFKYFEIYKEVEISFPQMNDLTRYNFTIFEHNLGFVPFFEVYDINLGTYIAPFSASGGPNIQQWTVSGGIFADKNRIYHNQLYQTANGYSQTKAILRIYNLDAAQEYVAPAVTLGPRQISKPSSYGLKITERKDPDALRDPEVSHFTLTTQSKALAIQKIGQAISDTSTGFQAIIDHDMGQPPTYLAAYMKPDKSVVGAINPDFIPVKATSNSKTLKFSGAQAALIGHFSYIIFKEFADFSL